LQSQIGVKNEAHTPRIAYIMWYMRHACDLPNDIDNLKQLVIELDAALEAKDIEIERLRLEIAPRSIAKHDQSSGRFDQDEISDMIEIVGIK
jgi:hypothetical protein